MLVQYAGAFQQRSRRGVDLRRTSTLLRFRTGASTPVRADQKVTEQREAVASPHTCPNYLVPKARRRMRRKRVARVCFSRLYRCDGRAFIGVELRRPQKRGSE